MDWTLISDKINVLKDKKNPSEYENMKNISIISSQRSWALTWNRVSVESPETALRN